jgi:ribosomal protein S24E
METKILKQTKNPFLKRTEYSVEIKSDSNPGEEAIKEFLKSDKELTIVRTIVSNFGRKTFLADVVVYDSAEAKQSVVIVPQKVRKEMEEAKKKAEAEAKKKAEAEKKAAEEAAKAAGASA